MKPCSRFTWIRLVTLLGILLATLQIYHMILLNRLDAQLQGLNEKQLAGVSEDVIRELQRTVHASFMSSPIIDSSGQYRIVYDVLQTENLQINKNNHYGPPKYQDYGITIATHCSVNHVNHLVRLSQQWQGPISVAIFIPQQYSPVVVEMLVLLHQCLLDRSHNVSVHMVFELTQVVPGLPTASSISSQRHGCEDFHKSFEQILHSQLENYNLGNQKYPNNLLRNVARRRVRSQFVLVIDIDMVPSQNLYQNFIKFTQKHNKTINVESQTVYVLPAFEIQEHTPIPNSKESLTKLWDQNMLRPFYYELCWKCQSHTNYATWRNLTELDSLQAAYSVPWKDPWEPFYIGPTNNLPYYDERFKQYGFNRISQVCELHIAGYQFIILSNAFLIHLGYKNQESFHQNKDIEQEHNRLLFRQFKEELKTKYPDSTNRC